MRKTISLSVAVAALFASTAAQAIPSFVGTFETDNGPWWTSNPAVYSAREAAAHIFGGQYTDYLISTNSSMDPATITGTGWYSRIGIAGGWEYAQDFSKDLGALGYGGPGWQSDYDISAYVGDNAAGARYTMYVWSNAAGEASVPEPATLALLGIGIAGIGVASRRSKQA